MAAPKEWVDRQAARIANAIVMLVLVTLYAASGVMAVWAFTMIYRIWTNG